MKNSYRYRTILHHPDQINCCIPVSCRACRHETDDKKIQSLISCNTTERLQRDIRWWNFLFTPKKIIEYINVRWIYHTRQTHPGRENLDIPSRIINIKELPNPAENISDCYTGIRACECSRSEKLPMYSLLLQKNQRWCMSRFYDWRLLDKLQYVKILTLVMNSTG